MKHSLDRDVRLKAEAGFRLPRLRGTPIQPRRLTSTYHDTADHRLAAAGVTLRYRTEDGSGAWQLELPSNGHRHELRLPGSPDAVPPRFHDLVAAALRSRPIAEVATLDTVRRGVRVERDGRAIADVTVDQVVVRAGDAAVRAFDELEVELVDGSERDLRKLTGKLHRAGARPGDQRPRLLRALGLDHPKPPRIDPGARPRDQLSAMLRIQYQAILAHDPGTRLGNDPEELHQHRVAVRRLRALLRAARPMLDRGWVDELRGELRWLGAVLGEVRDLDVLLEHLEGEAAALPADDARAFARILGVLANRREAARALMLAELRDARYGLLLDRLEHELNDPPPAGKAIAPRRIAAAEFKELRKAQRRLAEHPPDRELHELRILVKRARYAAELAAPGGGKRARRFVDAAKRVQDVLGDHQDATVAAEQLRALAAAVAEPRAALAAGIVVERQHARKLRARGEFPEAWAVLEQRGRKAWG